MMRPRHLVALLYCALPVVAQAQNKVNQDSLILRDFSRRIGDYAKLHKTVRSENHGLKPTDSALAPIPASAGRCHGGRRQRALASVTGAGRAIP